jgi:hypothetical protein
LAKPPGTRAEPASRYFDLNIEKVLEHWSVADALRELIANALDEQALTETREPEIIEETGGRWHIRDWGRGLRYEHFTQKEDPEKLRKPHLVIGKFGVGLKDAVAALERQGARVSFRSRHVDIRIDRAPKHGFEQLKTLHAVIGDPSDPELIGTDVVIEGVTAEQVASAKSLFLRYSTEEELERTKNGSVLRRAPGPARIYVNGLRVAEEPNFLFSYNITSLTKRLRQALNRERTNVGRRAYTDRVIAVLLECDTADVADRLADDLAQHSAGRNHDETTWLEVSLHACRVLNAHQSVIFVTADQLSWGGGLVAQARGDSIRIVVVPENVAAKLGRLKDLAGNPIRDLNKYRTEWNDSFEYDFVPIEALSRKEREIFALAEPMLTLVRTESKRVREIRVSKTMRLESFSANEAVGVWEENELRIVIKRDQLARADLFLGTLLHEIGHALSGAPDVDEEFEHGLTQLLGKTGQAAVKPGTGGAASRRPSRR